MKLRNKETENIGWLYCDHTNSTEKIMVFSEDKDLLAPHWSYNSLDELNAEWEDYEEPEEHIFYEILSTGIIIDREDGEDVIDSEIGNYFETKEEAELAVLKLKAWKRLKDKGLKISAKIYQDSFAKEYICLEANWGVLDGDFSDVFICFGGKE